MASAAAPLLSHYRCAVQIEDWAAADALYWSCVTITTIGFGDVTPDSDAGKVRCSDPWN